MRLPASDEAEHRNDLGLLFVTWQRAERELVQLDGFVTGICRGGYGFIHNGDNT